MSSAAVPQKLQSLGAHRFIGNISLATSASDIFAHVREMMEAGTALTKLKDSFARQSRQVKEDGVTKDTAAEQRLILSYILEGVAQGELSDRAKRMESFAALEDGGYHDSVMNSRWAITSGPLIPFLNKIKVELETERGLYKSFLDILTEYSSGGLSNMMTMVAVFGLFYHRHGLLSELCGHVLLLSDIPRSFPISKDIHFAKVKMPPKKQSLHQMEACRLKVAVNALPSFYPNGIHSIPLTSVSRLKKVTNTTKPSIPARNGSSTAMSSSSSGNSNSNSNTSRNFTLLNEANILSKPRRKGSSSSVPASNSSIGDSIDGSDTSIVNTIPIRKTRLNSSNTTGSICSDSTGSECKSDLPSRTRKITVVPVAVINPATISFSDHILIPSPEATSEVRQRDEVTVAAQTWIQDSNTPLPRHSPTTTSAQSSTAYVVKEVSSTSTAAATPKKKVAKVFQTPTNPSSMFEPSVQLPTTADPNDPPFTKEGRLNAGYIMNALLNHQFAEHFRDPKKPDNSSTEHPTTTSSSLSPSSSTLSTITDTDSTTSADVTGADTTESPPKTITSIPQHFNFSRMAERLKQGGYSSHLAFRRDFDGIIKFCREKNSFLQSMQRLDPEALEELEFEFMATDRLEKYFMNEWTYFFPELSGKRRGRTSVAAMGVDLQKESAKKVKR